MKVILLTALLLGTIHACGCEGGTSAITTDSNAVQLSSIEVVIYARNIPLVMRKTEYWDLKKNGVHVTFKDPEGVLVKDQFMVTYIFVNGERVATHSKTPDYEDLNRIIAGTR